MNRLLLLIGLAALPPAGLVSAQGLPLVSPGGVVAEPSEQGVTVSEGPAGAPGGGEPAAAARRPARAIRSRARAKAKGKVARKARRGAATEVAAAEPRLEKAASAALDPSAPPAVAPSEPLPKIPLSPISPWNP